MPSTILLSLTAAFVVLMLLAMVVWLMIVVLRQNKSHSQHLQTLLTAEQTRVQSLLNQVRSADPMTLMNLQATTLTTSSGTSDEYVPTGTDEDEFALQQELARQGGVGELVNYDDDLDLAGFIRRNDGGEPYEE